MPNPTTAAAIRNELATSAHRYLRSYLATGMQGFLRAGLDRCRELGIRTAACEAQGREGIEHLAGCLLADWIGE